MRIMGHWASLMEGEGVAAPSGAVPAPTPSVAPASEPATSPSSSETSDALGDMMSFRGQGPSRPHAEVPSPGRAPVVPQPPYPVVTQPAPGVAPVVPPVAPVPQPLSAAQPTPALPAQPPQAQPSQPSQQQPPTPSMEQQAQQYQSIKQNAAREIASRYQLSREQALQFQTEPEAMIPQMLGQLHVDVYEAVSTLLFAQMNQLITQMVPQAIQQQSDSTKAVDDFYGANPDLKGKDEAVIARIAGPYMKANPAIPRDQAYREIGALVRSVLGVALPTQAPPQAQPSGVPMLPISARTPMGPTGLGAPMPVNGQNPQGDILADMMAWRR